MFYEALPDVQYVEGHCAHVFVCAAKSCTYKCCHFLNCPDHSSTGNLIKHVTSCWGKAAYEVAKACQHVNDAHESVVKPLTTTGTITAAFEQKGKGKVSYRHRQHTKKETKSVNGLHLLEVHLTVIPRAEIVRWVLECPSLQGCRRPGLPFIDEDRQARLLHPIGDDCFKRCTNCFCLNLSTYWTDASSMYQSLFLYVKASHSQ